MCSLWKTMEESDDGDLEAVVRGYSRMNPYNWQPASARFDPGLSFRSPGGLVFPNLMSMTAPASPVGMDLQDLCRPFYGDGNGSVLRSASSCSSLMFESMEVNTASSSMFAAESSPPPLAVACIRKLGGIKEEKCPEILSSRVPEPRDVLGSKPVKVEPLKECDGSSSSLSQGVESGGTAQPVCKGQGSKRRKSQQKRIVCVPAAAGSNRPSGESLPSDLWAWRKYGQKPIKGSPYPRGYYRCSSSKGCSARKQVERSRTDPTMLVITYTSDHNHPWPTHRNALAGSTRQTPSEKNAPAESRAQKQENSETIIMPDGENNNNNNDSTTSAFSVAGGGGSISSADGENLSSGMIQDDQDPAAAAELRNLFRPEDDFFAELGELPEPLNMFARQNFDDDKSDEEEAASSVVDPFNLFNWSSLNPTPSPFVDTKTAM